MTNHTSTSTFMSTYLRHRCRVNKYWSFAGSKVNFGMKIAVLGGTGPSGRELISAALARSHQLTIFVRTPSKLNDSVRENPNVKIIQGTLDDENALRRTFQGQDAVISLLGPRPWKPSQVLVDSYKLIFAAMKAEEVTRFVGTGTPSYPDP